jgi:hypothetical protein
MKIKPYDWNIRKYLHQLKEYNSIKKVYFVTSDNL